MRHFIIITFLIIFSSEVFSQGPHGEKLLRIAGKVYDAKTMKPVPFTNIVNITSNTGTTANNYGEISFLINKSDTMCFKAIGYEEKLVCLKDSVSKNIFYLIVKLKSKAYILEEIEIIANNPMAGFRRDTTHIKTTPIYMGKSDYTTMVLGARRIASGYITGFANLFNQHYKQEMKLKKILALEGAEKESKYHHDSIQMVVNARYNKLIVGWITDLTGGDLDNFIKDYRPSDQFILTSSDYEFMLHIVNSFTDYQKKHGLEVDLDEILRKANLKY